MTMNFKNIFGSTPFEQVQAGIAKRVVMMGTAKAMKELILTYTDIREGMKLVKENNANDPVHVVQHLLLQAEADMRNADKEVVLLSELLETQLGISA